MALRSPKQNLERMQRLLNAWAQIAPAATFGGIKLSDFQKSMEQSMSARTDIAQVEAELDEKIAERDRIDAEGLRQAKLIINAVVGDAKFGPDSALYEAMGYIRESKRASGLTRKKAKSDESKK